MKLDALSSYTTNVALYLFPTKKLELKMKFYNLTNEVMDGHYHTCSLLDGDFNYKINNVWSIWGKPIKQQILQYYAEYRYQYFQHITAFRWA